MSKKSKDTPNQKSNPRTRGRPRRNLGTVDVQRMKKLLLEGETTPDGQVRKLTKGEVAKAVGIDPSLVSYYIRTDPDLQHLRLKQPVKEELFAPGEAEALINQRLKERLVEDEVSARILQLKEIVPICDAFLIKFAQKLKKGEVNATSPLDFEKVTRLKAFLMGEADSRQSLTGTITLDAIQARYVARQTPTELSSELTGELPRGLLESGDEDEVEGELEGVDEEREGV